jgi:sulfonate dioxygenase
MKRFVVLSSFPFQLSVLPCLTHIQYKYSAYLPVYDETTHFPPLQPFEFNDRGLAANKEKPNLLSSDNPSLKVAKLTPVIGTEIRGLQLSELNDAQKDELALLIAERGVVVFRDQDFKDIGIDKQKEFGQYFGPLHIHVRSLLTSYLGR